MRMILKNDEVGESGKIDDIKILGLLHDLFRVFKVK